MDRAAPHLLRMFDVAEMCWEDADTVVYAGRGFAIPRQTLLRAPKAPIPSAATLDRLVRHYTIASRLPRGCVVPVIALNRFGLSQGLLLEDVAGRPIRIEGPDVRARVLHAVRAAMAALDSLAVLHRHGIVHGHLVPGTLWSASKDGPVALFDLSDAHGPGLAPPVESVGRQPHHAYAPPESLRGSPASIGPAVDVFAVAAVLHEWLTGRPPFESGAPVPPAAWQAALPPDLASLLLRLLSPDPANRLTDLSAVRAELAACCDAAQASIARQDAERAAIGGDQAAMPRPPPRFYGRGPEQEVLLRCLDRVRDSRAGLVLITGPPGVGKTALAQRLQQHLADAGGLFAAGKFDQVARNNPYAALVQALSRLAVRILAEPEARFAAWKARLSAALGLNAQIAIDLVPDLALILGQQAPVQPLPPQEARNRFREVFRELLYAFAGPGRPLGLLLDDMQWADPATLELLHGFLSDPESAHVLFIGTCRTTGVDAAHPAAALLDALRGDGCPATVIELGGLTEPQVHDLVSDLLDQTGPHVGELAALLHRKSGGNAFTLEQLLRHLRDAGLVRYDRGLGLWCWNMRDIWDSDPNDDVVELLRERIHTQSADMRDTLATAACLGAAFDADRLATARGVPIASVRGHLEQAQGLGLVRPAPEPRGALRGATHRFVHDRVQQAAFSLLDTAQLPRIRLEIGRRLLRALTEEEALAAPFEIVDNINAGAALLEPGDERLLGARLNLAAGRLSRAALAFQAALDYQNAGLALLDASAWKTHYRLAFDLHAEAFECEHQTLHAERADHHFRVLIDHAATALDRASVYHTKILLDISSERYAEAMRIGRQALAELGVRFPRHARRSHLLRELLKARILMLRRSPASLEALADMRDARLVAAARILLSLSPGAYFVNPNATMLMGLKIVTLSMRAGNSPSSAGGYVLYGLALSATLRDSVAGQAFGELAVALARRFDDITVRSRTLLIHAGFVAIWRRPFAQCLASLREAHSTAIAAGDFAYANYALLQTLFLNLARGVPLPEYLEECERLRGFMVRTGDPFAIDNHANWVQSARALQGLTQGPADLHSEHFDETAAERRYRDGSNLTTLGYYLIRKLHLACLSGDTADAFRFGREAEQFFGLLPGQVLLAEHALYFGLTLVEMRRTHPALMTGLRLLRCRRRLRRWAAQAPDNYSAMHQLLEAAHATLQGAEAKVLPMFDAAIEAARADGFLNIEALAAELAARYCMRGGQSRAASAYLEEAISAYRAWGATAKVDALTGLGASAGLRPGQAAPQMPSPIVATAALSPGREVTPDGILQHLVAQAAAGRQGTQVVAVLRDRGSSMVRAANDGESVAALDEPLDESNRVSAAVVNYVLRSNSEVIAPDVPADDRFAACAHLKARHPVSVICMPIPFGGQAVGALYLEASPLAGGSVAATEALRALCADAGEHLEHARMESSLRQSRHLLHEAARAAESATRVRAHLEKFVPAVVTRLILNNPDTPELRRIDRDISVLFLDVEGYTALSEQHDRASLVRLLERYFSRYLAEIQRHGGDVNQTAGDGLMALFQEAGHHAQQAVRTAIAVHRATDEIASSGEDGAVPRIRLHIGINSGIASVGATRIEAAGAALWTYTAVGPAVNLASRIANAAQGGETLIGGATAERLAGAFQLDHVGVRRFKNVRGVTDVFRIIGTGRVP
jgi:predicted ATPase/class 3 adenylate cyclase